MRCEEPDRGEGETAGGEHFEQDRKLASGARSFDASVRGVLRQVQHARAVDEQGGAALREIEAPRVELRQRRDQPRGRLAFGANEAADFVDDSTSVK